MQYMTLDLLHFGQSKLNPKVNSFWAMINLQSRMCFALFVCGYTWRMSYVSRKPRIGTTIHHKAIVCFCWSDYFLSPIAPCLLVFISFFLHAVSLNLNVHRITHASIPIVLLHSPQEIFTPAAILYWCKWTCDALPFIHGHHCWQILWLS